MNEAAQLVEPIAMPLAFLLMFAGIAAQFVARMATIEDHGAVPPVLEYLRAHPWRCLNLLVGSSLLLLWLNGLGQLNEATAFATGYMCQDAAERVRQRAERRVGP